MSHESHPNPTPEPTPIPTAGEGQFANSETDPQLASFGMKREAGHPHQIDVIGGDLSPQTVNVSVGTSALNEKLNAPVYEPLSNKDLDQRRAEARKSSPVKNAVFGGLAAVAILGGLHVASKRLDNQQKAQMEQTQPVRDAVQANILANEQRATNDAIPPLDPNQIP